MYFLENGVKASCITNKYVQISLLWVLYVSASGNARNVPDFIVSICRRWNSKWYKELFWGKICVVVFLILYALLFLSFHDRNILLLLVNFCPVKGMRFLQHKIASGSPSECVPSDWHQPFETPWVGLSGQSVASLHALHSSKTGLYQSGWDLFEILPVFGCF